MAVNPYDIPGDATESLTGGGEGFFDDYKRDRKRKFAQGRFQRKYGDLEGQSELLDAYNLNKQWGVGDENAIMRRLRRAGLLDAEGNVINPEGYTANTDTSGWTEEDFVQQRNRLRAELRGPKSQFYRKNWQEMQASVAAKKMTDYKTKYIDPLTKSVNERIQEMLENPAISPEDVTTMRSEAVSQARAQEAQRLNRVAATLGIRGLDAGSVAGAALMNRIGEETDARITEGLRRFGLDVAQLEQSSQQTELGLSTSLSAKMAALETALTQGNLEQVFQIQNDLGAIYAAMQSQDEAIDVQKEANRYGLYGSVIGAAGNILD